MSVFMSRKWIDFQGDFPVKKIKKNRKIMRETMNNGNEHTRFYYRREQILTIIKRKNDYKIEINLYNEVNYFKQAAINQFLSYYGLNCSIKFNYNMLEIYKNKKLIETIPLDTDYVTSFEFSD